MSGIETASASDVPTGKPDIKVSRNAPGGTGAELGVAYRGATEETGQGFAPQDSEPLERERSSRRSRRLPPENVVDPALITKARELVDSIDPDDPFDAQLHLEALKGTVAEMWDSAADCSGVHQDILATLENGVRQAALAGTASREQLAAFREALHYLGQASLVRENANVVRSEFVRQGFAALGFANNSDEDDASEG